MCTTVRHYKHAVDYERVSRFLVRTYGARDGHVNWLQPRWEYMHYHPLIRDIDLSAIGISEARGEVVGVVHPEHTMGTAYLEIDPDCSELKGDILSYAEEHISTLTDGVRRLRNAVLLVPGFPAGLQSLGMATGVDRLSLIEEHRVLPATLDPCPQP